MLIEWMAYATLLTAFFCCAALAAEHVVAIWRGGRRFVWLATAIAAIVVPAALSVRRIAVVTPVASTATPTTSLTVLPRSMPAVGARSAVPASSLFVRAQHSLVTLDPYLRDVWLAASLLLLGFFLRATIGLRRERSRWREIDLAGERLLLAPNSGPAVVGVLHPRVVVPHWALSLDPAARELMLRHEAEHIRARDPQLVVVAAFALVLFPWNAGLWFIVRRLRLAVEVDCDQRVLRGSVQPRDYGMLLLTVGARHSASLPLAVSLAERRPFLERRIRAMTTPRPRKPLLASLALMSVAVAATTAASKAPRPTPFVMHASVPRQLSRPVEQPTIESVAPIVAPSVAPRASAPAATPASRIATETAVKSASPAKSLIAPTRGPGVPIELIRALVKMYHPNVVLGDSSVNLVTIVLDHDLNYVYSSTGKTPTAEASGSATEEGAMRKKLLVEALVATNDSAAKVEMATVRTAKQSADYEKGRALGMAYKIESRGDDVSDSVRARYAATEKFAAEASARAAKLDISPEAIGSIEVRKFAGGTFGPYDFGVIVIVLKEDAQAHYKFGQIF